MAKEILIINGANFSSCAIAKISVNGSSGGGSSSGGSTTTLSAPTIAFNSSNNTVAITGTGSIYYTTNGSTPTTSSTLYQGAFTLSAGTTTVKAICVSGGVTSAVASKTVTIESSEPETEQSYASPTWVRGFWYTIVGPWNKNLITANAITNYGLAESYRNAWIEPGNYATHETPMTIADYDTFMIAEGFCAKLCVFSDTDYITKSEFLSAGTYNIATTASALSASATKFAIYICTAEFAASNSGPNRANGYFQSDDNLAAINTTPLVRIYEAS